MVLKISRSLLWLERWSIYGLLIGLIGGISAVIFSLLVSAVESLLILQVVGDIATRSTISTIHCLIPLVVALGGLISGIIVYTFAPEAEGHGTDAVISSVHLLWGKIRRRVPIVKIISSAITIGTGGSAGKEGPIAQVGAGFGSWLADTLNLNDEDRRTMVLCGVAAGIAAIFRAPLGAAIFAIEVLYRRDMEIPALVPTVISSIVAYSVFVSFMGSTRVFHVPTYEIPSLYTLCFYALLGVILGVLALVYVKVFYSMRDSIFRRLPGPKILAPTLGGLSTGLLALLYPQILGPGYEWIQHAILGDLDPYLMIILAFTKILATSFTIASGGSGGVFAPSLFIGAMMSGALGRLLHTVFPKIDPTSFTVVGMAAFFAGAAKVPLASILMVAEMSGSYELLVPAIIASVISYTISGKSTIYESQVRSRIESLSHLSEVSLSILRSIRVGDIMTRNVTVISPKDRAIDVLKLSRENGHSGHPVVLNGKLVGIVTHRDIMKIDPSKLDRILVEEIMTRNLVTTTPEETLDVVIDKMYRHGVGRLLVVDPECPQKLIGIVTEKDIIRTYEELIHEYLKSHPKP
ncbi:MAG: chloride channel protein [Thermoprotei archaeon]|nr:MAG: chloride channel protein [Thermoprotei archaeon]